MDDSATIITHDNTRITNSNTFPTDKEHNNTFPDQRICHVTRRVYISFTLESEFNLSQIKYGSKYNTSGGIIETLRVNLAFLKMEKCYSKKEASIAFFLGVNPKLTLRNALKQKIDETCPYILPNVVWGLRVLENPKDPRSRKSNHLFLKYDCVYPRFCVHEFHTKTNGNKQV